jgi:hypothetical protein
MVRPVTTWSKSTQECGDLLALTNLHFQPLPACGRLNVIHSVRLPDMTLEISRSCGRGSCLALCARLNTKVG